MINRIDENINIRLHRETEDGKVISSTYQLVLSNGEVIAEGTTLNSLLEAAPAAQFIYINNHTWHNE